MIDIEKRWRHFSLNNYLQRRNIKDSVNLRQALCFTFILNIYIIEQRENRQGRLRTTNPNMEIFILIQKVEPLDHCNILQWL